MTPGWLLSWIVFLPALGAVLVLLPASAQRRKQVALAFSAAPLLLSLWLGLTASGSTERYGDLLAQQRVTWIETSGGVRIEYFLGVDGLSLPLIVLTCLVSTLAVAASWNFETWKTRRGLPGYLCLLLLLQTGMLGVFAALDFFLFYVFWEVMLLPMYFLVGVWGGERRQYAAIKFFIYALVGSVLILIVMLAMYFYPPASQRTFDILRLATDTNLHRLFNDPETLFLGLRFSTVMFALLAIGFFIKVPVVPLHTWLPDAHVEAPTPVSMILAGILLKMGGYGLLRFCYPMFPAAAEQLAVPLGILGVVSILYGAFCALAQDDLKRLVAYSSISHMGYVVLGLAAMTPTGMHGALFQMIAHGVSSPMCFFLVGVIYDRVKHREIDRLGGLWLRMPLYGSMATIGFFATLGLPALCGFVGEVLAILGAFQSATLAAAGNYHLILGVLAASGAIVNAAYVLWMLQRVYLGSVRSEHADLPDATNRELAILAPLAALCILLGVLPQQTVLNWVGGTLQGMLEISTRVAAAQ